MAIRRSSKQPRRVSPGSQPSTPHASLISQPEELRVADPELKCILDNAGHGIRIIKKDYTVKRINRAFADMSGVSPYDVRGKKCCEIFPVALCVIQPTAVCCECLMEMLVLNVSCRNRG